MSAFHTQKGTQSAADNAMKSTVNALGGSWLGEASNAYQTQFQPFFNHISQSEAKMADAVSELAKSADLFMGAEIERLKPSTAALEVGRSPFA